MFVQFLHKYNVAKILMTNYFNRSLYHINVYCEKPPDSGEKKTQPILSRILNRTSLDFKEQFHITI